MSKRARHRKAANRPGNRKQRRTPRRRPVRPAEPDLLGDVAAALADDHPLALLGLVSTLLAAIEPRPGPFEPPAGPDLPSREELVATFLEVDLPETSALLAALAELLGEDVLRRRVRRELASRGHALPRWLVELDRAETVGEAVGVGHVLGDGDDIMFGVRLSGGRELSVAVYVDHNLGTVAKDAFVVPEPLPGLVEQMLATIDDPDTTAGELDRADAGVRITEAIDRGKITFPPFETDTWPGCRPLVEWAVRLLPTGGTGYRRPEWDDDALAALTERFLASPFGAEFDDADHRGLLESLLWFGTDYGPGDPLRWSPVAVEILLADWIPRKIVADAPYLAKAPALLRAFIRFCHHERGIRPALTALTLAAVDEHEPGYRRTIRSPRPQGPAALLAAMGALDPDGPWPPLDAEPPGLPEIMLDALRRAVGSESALDALDASPLPDESFDWRSIPADIHDRVAEVLALVDRGSGELLDVESRTACRRLLARAAAGDPEIFRRRGRAATAAAAICWIIGKANRSVGADGVAVKDLTGHFGLGRSTVSPRSKPLLRAIGVAPEQYGGMDLASPDYLTAARRGQIIADRDRYRAMRDPR